VYLTAFFSLVAVLFISSWIGGDELGPWRTSLVLRDAPDVIGVVTAVAILVGLRSGARGGPLAIEPGDARHVLLAPIDRGLALRSPALKQLRFAAFAAIVVGGVAGQLASHRLPGNVIAFVASGAAFGLVTVGLAYGAALIAGGRRLPILLANLLGGALLLWAVADAVDWLHWSPTGLVGTIPLWPLDVEPLALVPAAVALVAVVLGVVWIGGASLEGGAPNDGPSWSASSSSRRRCRTSAPSWSSAASWPWSCPAPGRGSASARRAASPSGTAASGACSAGPWSASFASSPSARSPASA
jgi:hypothetical protein